MSITTTSISSSFLETVCPDCFCFTGRFANSFDHASCHKVACNGDGAYVYFGTVTVLCPKSGGIVDQIDGYTGSITCPPYSQLCEAPCPNSCYGNGNCVSGNCKCHDGYSGRDCVIKCDLSCKTCDGLKATECGSCYENASLENGVCTCSVEYKQSITTKKCIPCDETCLTCSGPANTKCLTCTDNSTFDPNSGTCPCKRYYVRSTDMTKCLPCYDMCETCQDITDTSCLSCKSNASLPLGKTMGACTCDLGYFLKSDDYTCAPCHISCKACSGPDSSKCSDCYENAILSFGSCTCNDGYIADITTKRCIPCHVTCVKCSGPENTQCLTCTNNSYLSKSGECSCNDKYTRSSDLKLCVPCHASCETCRGTTAANCLTCKGSAILPSGESLGVCSCSSGFYMKSDFTCAVCDGSCKECNGIGPTQCTKCYEGAKAPAGRCICTETGFFESGIPGKCSKCSDNCLNCKNSAKYCVECDLSVSKLEKNICKCKPTGVFQTISGKCIACDPSCKNCLGASYASCISCPANANLSNPRNIGICPCASNYYVDVSNDVRKCLRCDPSCKECNNSDSTSCTKCYDNAELTYTNSCECKDMYFPSPTAIKCVKCHPDCLTCRGLGKTACLSCFNQAERTDPMTETSSCKCVKDAYSSSTMNNCGTKGCHSDCKKCINAGNKGCTECWDNALGKGPWFPFACECTEGYFPIANSVANCELCDSACYSCNGPSRFNCLTCKSPYVLIDGLYCGDECPTGQSNDRGICQARYNEIFQLKLDFTDSTLMDKVGQTSIQANSAIESDPGPLPYYQQGRVFNGKGDYLAFDDESGKLLFGGSHSMEFWFRYAANAPLGCLISIHDSVFDNLLLRFCVTDTARLLLEFASTSLKDPSVTSLITLLRGDVTKTRKWTLASFQLEQLNKKDTIATLFIGRISVGYAIYADIIFSQLMENTEFVQIVMGASYSNFPNLKDFFTGSIAEISMYNGKFPNFKATVVCPTGFTVSTGGLCLNPCFSGEYQAGTKCPICGSECANGCIQGSDCKVTDLYVCAEVGTVVGCSKCGQLSRKSSVGDCKCVNNAVVYKGICQCITDYSKTSEGECELCLPYFTSAIAKFSADFLKVVITFPKLVRTKPTCDKLFVESTAAEFGKGYTCTWNKVNEVTVKFGTAPTLTKETTIYLNWEKLYAKEGTCSFSPSNIGLSVTYTSNPTINIKFDPVLNYPLLCNSLLNLDASKTTGVINRPMKYIWTLSSDPSLGTLDLYKGFVTSAGVLSVLNTQLTSDYSTFILTVELTVSNTLGAKSTKTATITVTGKTVIGLIIEKGPTIYAKASSDTTITVKPTCKLSTAKYSWSFISSTSGHTIAIPTKSAAYSTSLKLTIPKKTFNLGVKYTFEVAAIAGETSGSSRFFVDVTSKRRRVKSGDNEMFSAIDLDEEQCKSSFAPVGIVSIIVILGLLSSAIYRIIDRKSMLFEAEKSIKVAQELGKCEEEQTANNEQSAIVQNTTNINEAFPKVESKENIRFSMLFLESHCVTGLFVHSSRLFRCMKMMILTEILMVEMAVIGAKYAQEDYENEDIYDELKPWYGYDDFLYCLIGLGVGLGVSISSTSLFTILSSLKSLQTRKINILLAALSLVMICVAAGSALYLALGLCSDVGSRWAVSFLPTLGGEVLVGQTLAALTRSGLIRLLD